MRFLGYLWKVLISLVAVAVALAMLHAAHSQFETIVISTLVIIYASVIGSFQALGRGVIYVGRTQLDVVVTEMVDASPVMRDQGEFITVRQAVSEQGLDATQMPLPGSRQNLSGLAGQMLKVQKAEHGASVVARVDGSSVATE